jgi:hypothetical protein
LAASFIFGYRAPHLNLLPVVLRIRTKFQGPSSAEPKGKPKGTGFFPQFATGLENRQWPVLKGPV